MIGTSLSTLCTSLNGGATIDATLLTQLVNIGKNILEEERPWMVLRKTDTSKTVTTASLYTTAISLATIAQFNKFYGNFAVRLFDGANRIEYYRQVPWDERLVYKDVGNTFCYDVNSGNIYLNGVVPFNGTLYINYLTTLIDIDLTSSSEVWSPFPPRFGAILAFYAVGVNKGAIDYDIVNSFMTPSNQQVLTALRLTMLNWDNELQQSAIELNDPTDQFAYPRAGAIDISGF